MRAHFIGAVALTLVAAAATGQANTAQTTTAQTTTSQTTSHAPAQRFTTADTPIGELLDNAAANAILKKHLPDVVNSDQIDMARGMTLLSIQPYASDVVTDEKLAAIDAELAEVSTDSD